MGNVDIPTEQARLEVLPHFPGLDTNVFRAQSCQVKALKFLYCGRPRLAELERVAGTR